LLLKLIFTILKTALKIELKKIEEDPKKLGKSYGKRESKQAPLERKFQGFCDIFNGIRAMAILLILFCM